ncbi:MAG: hypothetical protein AMS22_08070, partial [Thiotrichales bacterium SG8_50]
MNIDSKEQNMKTVVCKLIAISLFALLMTGCSEDNSNQLAGVSAQLTDEQVENIVRRSYQYVAMYNVNNK